MPTPTMAPVMVCVVLTGIPASAVPNRVMAPAVSAQNPPTGFSLVIFEPMVCTMRQPPEICAQRDREIGGQDDRPVPLAPVGGEISLLHDASGVERAGDDAHGFLRVIAAVSQAVKRRRDQLQFAEELVHLARRPATENPGDGHHEAKSQHKPHHRRHDNEDQGLRPARRR